VPRAGAEPRLAGDPGTGDRRVASEPVPTAWFASMPAIPITGLARSGGIILAIGM